MGGPLTIKRWVLTTKLFQRKKDDAGVDSFRIEAIVSLSTTTALVRGYGGQGVAQLTGMGKRRSCVGKFESSGFLLPCQ